MARQRTAGDPDRADLIGETAGGDMVHLEFMSVNQTFIELRMAGYYVEIYQAFHRHPRQALIYVGREKLRMRGHFRSPTLNFRFRVVDFRELDGERFLDSDVVGDQEIRNVPILDSLLDHKVLGREFKKGMAQGREQGRNEGEATLLRRLLERRFGKLPKWVDRKVATATPAQLEEWGERFAEQKSLDAIFGRD